MPCSQKESRRPSEKLHAVTIESIERNREVLVELAAVVGRPLADAVEHVAGKSAFVRGGS